MPLKAEIQILSAASSRTYSLPFWLFFFPLFLVMIFCSLWLPALHTHAHVYTRLIAFRLNRCSSVSPDHHLPCHIPHHFQPQLRFGFSKFIPAYLENISVFLLCCLSHVPLPHPLLVSVPAVAGCSVSCSGMQECFWELLSLADCCLACGFKRKGDVGVLLRGFNYHSSWSSNLSHWSQA